MAQWRVRTAEKKNVFIRTTYHIGEEGVAANKTFFMEEWYRWGSCLITSDDKPTESDQPYTIPFCLDEHEVDDQEADDGCSLMFEFPEYDAWTDEEKQYIEDLWENGEFYDQDFWVEDSETEYYGPLEVELVDSTEDTPPSPPPAGSSWPF